MCLITLLLSLIQWWIICSESYSYATQVHGVSESAFECKWLSWPPTNNLFSSICLQANITGIWNCSLPGYTFQLQFYNSVLYTAICLLWPHHVCGLRSIGRCNFYFLLLLVLTVLSIQSLKNSKTIKYASETLKNRNYQLRTIHFKTMVVTLQFLVIPKKNYNLQV